MADWRGRHVLITGAAGFIGNALSERLAALGARVTGMVRRSVPGVWHDEFICDLDVPEEQLLPESIHIVFHLAGRVHQPDDDPKVDTPYMRTNVAGTRWLLEAARAREVRRFVYVSSTKAMGEGTAETVDEETRPRPQDAYGRSKLAAERLVLDAGSKTNLETVVVRLPAVYGPGSKGNIAQMLERIRSGRFPPLPEFGNRRSLVHVANVVDALLLVGSHPNAAGEEFLVTDGCDRSTRALYEAMCAALGKAVLPWSIPRWALGLTARAGDGIADLTGLPVPMDSVRYSKLAGSASYSCEKLSSRLGYTPKHTLAQGLSAMVAELERAERSRQGER